MPDPTVIAYVALWIVPVGLGAYYMIRLHRTVRYVGRHRPDVDRTPYVEGAWSVAFEDRIRDHILTSTAEMVLPDFDGDVGSGGDAKGSPGYKQLQTWRLNRDARLARLGVRQPRSPWGTPETADEWADDRELVGATS